MTETMLRTGLSLWTLCAETILNLTLLGSLFGYEKRRNRWVFRSAFALMLMLQTVFALTLREAESLKLSDELCLLAAASILPYTRFRPHKKMTFAWSGLMLCAVFDYLEFVLCQFLHAPTYRTEQIFYAALYGAAAISLFAAAKFGNLRLLPFFLEHVPPVLCVSVFLAEYSAYYESTLQPDRPAEAVLSAALRVLSAVLFVGSAVYMFARYTRLARRYREDEVRHTLQTQHYEELMEKNRDVRAFRHDYKNNLIALDALLQSGRAEDAVQYIRTLADTLSQTRSAYSCGNLLADAVLTDKARRAAEFGIEIEFDGCIPAKGIANRDLCTILANALDNAVEGCIPCAPCAVSVHAAAKPGGMTLTVSNPVRERVRIRAGQIRTGKSDAENHGFGLGNIRRTVKRYDGYADVKCDEKTFTLEVGLIWKGEETT